MTFLLAFLLHLVPSPVTGRLPVGYPMPCYSHTVCDMWSGTCWDDATCHTEPADPAWEW